MANLTKFLIFLGILALILTGCLQETNDADNSIALASPSPTLGSSVPSSEDIVSNPVVAQSVTGNQDAQSVPNNEISAFNGVSAPQDTVQQQAAPTVAVEQIPQQSQLETGATPTLDPLYARATQIILEPTYTSVALTQAALNAVQPLPTFTFTPQASQPQQFVPTFTPQPTAFIAGSDCVHEVVQGENLFRLSLRYGVNVTDIARVSGVTNINLIIVGQKLTIPGCGTTGARPPATSIPTQSANLAQVNSASTPIPSAGGVTHIVQQSETLFEISLQYGVPVNSIAARNGISNINLIYINQELIIP